MSVDLSKIEISFLRNRVEQIEISFLRNRVEQQKYFEKISTEFADQAQKIRVEIQSDLGISCDDFYKTFPRSHSVGYQ